MLAEIRCDRSAAAIMRAATAGSSGRAQQKYYAASPAELGHRSASTPPVNGRLRAPLPAGDRHNLTRVSEAFAGWRVASQVLAGWPPVWPTVQVCAIRALITGDRLPKAVGGCAALPLPDVPDGSLALASLRDRNIQAEGRRVTARPRRTARGARPGIRAGRFALRESASAGRVLARGLDW